MSQEEEIKDSSLCSVPDYLRVCYDPTSSYDDVLKEDKKRKLLAAAAASSTNSPSQNNGNVDENNNSNVPIGRWFYQCSPSGMYTTIPHALESLKKEFEMGSKEEVKRYLCPSSVNQNKSCSEFSMYGEGKWQCIPQDYEESMSVLNPYFIENVDENLNNLNSKKEDKNVITSPHSDNNETTLLQWWNALLFSLFLTSSRDEIQLSSFLLSLLFTALLSGIVLFFILSIVLV